MIPARFLRRAAAGLLSLCLGGGAVAGELFSDSVKSATLGRDFKFTIYLPDGYKDAPGKFPVVYLLHGASGDENEWGRKGGAVETLDGLIRRGLIRPSALVYLESPSAAAPALPPNWHLHRQGRAGDVCHALYRRDAGLA